MLPTVFENGGKIPSYQMDFFIEKAQSFCTLKYELLCFGIIRLSFPCLVLLFNFNTHKAQKKDKFTVTTASLE